MIFKIYIMFIEVDIDLQEIVSVTIEGVPHKVEKNNGFIPYLKHNIIPSPNELHCIIVFVKLFYEGKRPL